MTTYYFCNKGSLAVGTCVNGSDGADGLSPANAKQTLSAFATLYNSAAAGTIFLFAQGAAWDSALMVLKNLNATKTNPVTIDSYDASSVWSGGAGIDPIWSNTAAGSITILNWSKGTVAHSEGYVIRNIEFRGGGSGARAILIAGDTDWVTIETCTFTTLYIGVQAGAGTGSVASGSDGISSNLTIRGCTFSNLNQFGCLTGLSCLLVEDNTFDHIGTSVFDHGLYVGGSAGAVFPQTISSLTGDGATVTMVTAAPHNIRTFDHFVITVTGATASGFNVSAVEGTVVNSTTVTYPAAVSGTASVNGSYTINQCLENWCVTVRNNTFSEGNIGAAGNGNNAHLVVHGDCRNLLIEGNTFSESVAPTSGSCVGIEIDSGGYSMPEEYETLDRIVIRNNTIKNMGGGILVDICRSVLIENNHVYTAATVPTIKGIGARSKNGVPTPLFTGTATAGTTTTLTDGGASFTGLLPSGDRRTTVVRITGGTGAGQRKYVGAYTSTVLTLNTDNPYSPFSPAPDNTSTYAIANQSAYSPLNNCPSNITIRYNTVVLNGSSANSAAISLNGNGTDALTGVNHNIYGNCVVLIAPAATSVMAFNTAQLTLSTMFAVKDYNFCYYTGATVPKWENTSTLATIQAGGTDTHSTMASTTSITADQPFFTANPPITPAITTSSALKNAGHPTLGPTTAWGGAVRNQGASDAGAFEYGATTGVVPCAPIIKVSPVT